MKFNLNQRPANDIPPGADKLQPPAPWPEPGGAADTAADGGGPFRVAPPSGPPLDELLDDVETGRKEMEAQRLEINDGIRWPRSQEEQSQYIAGRDETTTRLGTARIWLRSAGARVWGLCCRALRLSSFPTKLFGTLAVVFLLFNAMANWSAFTTGQLNPARLVFNNNLTRLWITAEVLTFIVGSSLFLVAVINKALWRYFRPDEGSNEYDLTYDIRFRLTPTQRVWLFTALFLAFAFLSAIIYSVKPLDSFSGLR